MEEKLQMMWRTNNMHNSIEPDASLTESLKDLFDKPVRGYFETIFDFDTDNSSSNAYQNEAHYSSENAKHVTKRERIYGKEYGTLRPLDIAPVFSPDIIPQNPFQILDTKHGFIDAGVATEKDDSCSVHETTVKILDVPAFILSESESLSSTHIQNSLFINNEPKPTPTDRNYSTFELNYDVIPTVCSKCFSIYCFCEKLQNYKKKYELLT